MRVLLAVLFGVLAGCGDSGGTFLSGSGFCASVPGGWHSRIVLRTGPVTSPPALVLSNFELPLRAMEYDYGHAAPGRWPNGGILISVSDWTRGAPDWMKRKFPPASLPLTIRASDFPPFEGVAANLGRREVTVRGRLFEVWVQARPENDETLGTANDVLGGIRPYRS